MLEFLSKGGVLVYPILACLVLVSAIFVERMIRFTSIRMRGPALAETVAGLVRAGEHDVARKTASDSMSPLGRVLDKAVQARGNDPAMLETVMVNAITQEIQRLLKHIQLLATLGNIAPILGLLGTVIGMIKAFMVIQEMGGKVNAAVLAGGIWEAMLTTALGLSVALPAMLAHSYLSARVDRHESGLREGAVAYMQTLSTK